MGASINQQAAIAAIARFESLSPLTPGEGLGVKGRAFAQERFRQFQRDAALADAGRADEQIGVGKPIARDNAAKGVDAIAVAEDLGPGHNLSLGSLF
jgi:hypothetical protein